MTNNLPQENETFARFQIVFDSKQLVSHHFRLKSHHQLHVVKELRNIINTTYLWCDMSEYQWTRLWVNSNRRY